MTSRRVLYAVSALLLINFQGKAQQTDTQCTIKTLADAERLVPRLHRQSVKSLVNDGSQPLDTVDTSSPGVKLILYANNTWKYWRDPDDIMLKEVFTEKWDNVHPDPYNTSLAELPDKINLWIVDTLNEYKCPYQTKVYSPFGMRRRRRHQGVDLPLVKGTPVYSAFAGKVRMSKYLRGYGNLVIVRHENGLETFYGHLSKRLVEPGDWVEAGQEIGLGGNTGRSTGSHLHFETRYKGYAFDPQWLIDFETGTLRHRLFTLNKKYLNANSKYVPETDDVEIEIYLGDKRDYEVADSIAAVRKAEEERAAKEAAAARYVTVRSGDTLGRIAINNGTTITAICKLNPGLTRTTVLKIGRKIRVK